MCGIAGIAWGSDRSVPQAWLDEASLRLAPRGPDGSGSFTDAASGDATPYAVAFVHRRLAVIDPAGGAQPMVSQRGPHGSDLAAVVFNGCLYNHRALRTELEALGHVFTSDHSDTEVLLHGWRAWGRDLPRHLNGMYAAALWDRGQRTLVLLRDPFGQKPLFVAERTGPDGETAFVFASDAGAARTLADRAGTAPERDPRAALRRYLQLGYFPPDADGLAPDGVDELAPGELRTIDLAAGRTTRTVPPLLGERDPRAPVADAATLEALLDAAVRRRLEADVPLGCFLSGGVDSSLIAHMAQERTGDLRTFSVRMPDPRYDESEYAEHVAAHLGTRHETLDADARVADDLAQLAAALGRPFADSSILPTHWVSRAARRHVTVALSGDGGDELFLGYDRYFAARLLARRHGALARLPEQFGARAHPKSRRSRIGRLGAMARDFPRTGLAAMESIFPAPLIDALTGDGGDLHRVDPGDDALAALRADDLARYLPGDLLRKVDVASMTVALEVRCPFLDPDLAAATLTTPITRLAPNGERKGLLRAIARAHLPSAIVDRPKMGFAVPISDWLRSDAPLLGLRPLLNDTLASTRPFGRYNLDPATVTRLRNEHDTGQRDHGQRLFALLMLGLGAA